MSDEVVRIFSTRDEAEARALRRQLAIAGIEAIVTGERLGVAFGLDTINQDALPSLWVDSRDAERAAAVVQQWIASGADEFDAAELTAWRCPACGETVEGQFAACWNCGEVRGDDAEVVAAMAPGDAPTSGGRPRTTGRTLKIFTARDALEAHHVRGMLEAAGIPAAVMGETLSLARGELPMTQETLPSVWVHEHDQAPAMKIVHDWTGPSPGQGDRPPEDVVLAAWQCPQCGEQVEPQFTTCWNCNTDRPL